MIRNDITFNSQMQHGLPSLDPYTRLRAMGHTVGCTCEYCFVYVERALNRYLPGFLPIDPMELELRELKKSYSELRRENAQLKAEIKESELAYSRRRSTERPAAEYRGVHVEP